MNKLDKLFKDKLQDRSFEFNDSYWEAAERLIEQEESRKKRGGLWWKLGLFLLVLITSGYFLIGGAKSSAAVSGTEVNWDSMIMFMITTIMHDHTNHKRSA